METYSLFVYGTLIHPHILARVLAGNLGAKPDDDDHARFARLSAVPAIVTGHELRRVRGQEYPGLVAAEQASSLPAADIEPVRGVIVHGLTWTDLLALDAFEGDEYARSGISAIVPASEEPVSNDVRAKWSPDTISDILDTSLPTERVQGLLAGTEPANTIQVLGYIWIAGADELEEVDGPRGPWVFSSFSRNKSSRWLGGAWQDAGGPDGVVEDTDQEDDAYGAAVHGSAATPIPGTGSSSHGGFDEVRRTLATDAHGGSHNNDNASSFSGMSLAAADDPWADPPSALISPAAAVEKSDNPWAASSDVATTEPHASQSVIRREEIPAGFPLELQGVEMPGYERFGRPVSRLWSHGVQPGKEGRRYLAFNNGGAGSCPKPVLDAHRKWVEKADENADLFYRRIVLKHMRALRERLSVLLNCPLNTLAVITNATTGTNAVMHSFPWEAGDCVLAFGTLYGAVRKTLQFRQDMLPAQQPEIVELGIYLPIKNDTLIDLFREKIRALKAEGKRVRMAAFDAICSGPGVLVPWERLCKVCKEEGVLSFVDAAHAFGQIPIDLEASQPDFFVTNAHKWGYAHRSSAIFYVPLQNQHYVHSGVPTGWNFRPRAEREAHKALNEGDDFIKQWEEVGTIDWSSLLSIDAALDFREQRLGGEERIRAYTHSLALLGGLAVARILGTDLLETMQPAPGDGKTLIATHTASMVNVRLPLASRAIGTDVDAWLWSRRGESWMWDTLMDEFGVAVRLAAVTPPPSSVDADGAKQPTRLVYARISAQIWLELADFEYLGRALKEVCRRINAGEAEGILPEGHGGPRLPG